MVDSTLRAPCRCGCDDAHEASPAGARIGYALEVALPQAARPPQHLANIEGDAILAPAPCLPGEAPPI